MARTIQPHEGMSGIFLVNHKRFGQNDTDRWAHESKQLEDAM